MQVREEEKTGGENNGYNIAIHKDNKFLIFSEKLQKLKEERNG